jgi:hypothetical protein
MRLLASETPLVMTQLRMEIRRLQSAHRLDGKIGISDKGLDSHTTVLQVSRIALVA